MGKRASSHSGTPSQRREKRTLSCVLSYTGGCRDRSWGVCSDHWVTGDDQSIRKAFQKGQQAQRACLSPEPCIFGITICSIYNQSFPVIYFFFIYFPSQQIPAAIKVFKNFQGKACCFPNHTQPNPQCRLPPRPGEMPRCQVSAWNLTPSVFKNCLGTS